MANCIARCMTGFTTKDFIIFETYVEYGTRDAEKCARKDPPGKNVSKWRRYEPCNWPERIFPCRRDQSGKKWEECKLGLVRIPSLANCDKMVRIPTRQTAKNPLNHMIAGPLGTKRKNKSIGNMVRDECIGKRRQTCEKYAGKEGLSKRTHRIVRHQSEPIAS